MQILAQALDSFDKAMGIESVPCASDNPQALALVGAGLCLLDSERTITPETRLSEIGEPSELLRVLKNLDAVYLPVSNMTVGNDIIADVTAGEMISHLDATKVNTLIEAMMTDERREASKVMHASLTDLDNQIRA